MNRINRIATKVFHRLYPISVTKNGQQVEKLGNNYGFGYIPVGAIRQDSIIYSVGAGLDLHWDVEAIRKYRCPIYIFDPTPGAVAHFKTLKEKTAQGLPFHSSMGTPYRATAAIVQKMHFCEWALWKKDEKVKFFVPSNEKHISHSITDIQATGKHIEVDAKTLRTSMQILGHQHIDLLKLDIEGAEYKVLEDIMRQDIDIQHLYIEYHYSDLLSPYKNVHRILDSLQMLAAKGYTVIHNNKNKNITLTKKI